MKTVCICGHFGFGEELLNGQTVKTKIVSSEISKSVGKDEVILLDTHGRFKTLFKLPFQCLKAMRNCKNIVILPAQNGLRIIVPILAFYNIFFKRKLHYIVIGGWLVSFIGNKKVLAKHLKQFECIYVETNAMKKNLEDKGFDNVIVMPNCKKLKLLKKTELVYSVDEPLRLCTFSRVMKEKGIEEAVEAVKEVNKRFGRVIYTLDIYGQIDSGQIEWFDNLKRRFPDYITYGGIVPFDKSVEVIKEYFALLFPTYYEGEGFAGTIIDAYSAGVPVIVTDWKYNSEVVTDGYDGTFVEPQDVNDLEKKLIEIFENKNRWNDLKINCLNQAERYLPEKVICTLIERL